ncbi:MAG: molybdopterin-dependent oxidoreductase [Candidatus Aminicenantes bacterium]|nr:molybdopterin-dependent oxidoreductase [Candidatus Aminicenantes bacterium]
MKKDANPDIVVDKAGAASSLSRREFLKVVGGGIFIFVTYGEELAFEEPARSQAARPSLPTDFNAFLRIGEDGRVTCFTGKIEQGQGAITALPQMLAEELEVPLSSVDIVLGDTDLCPWDAGTFGSQTIRSFGPALRGAAAEAREVLKELAAEKLNVPIDRLQAKDGAIFDKTRPQTRATYAELAQGKKIERHLTQKPALKTPAELKVMGQPQPRRDALKKVTGEAHYAGDLRLPGMLYARILRPPAHGAKLKDLDTSAAEKISGARVIRDGDLIAVLHEFPDEAERAMTLIKAQYDLPDATLDDKNIFDHLIKAAPEGRTVAQGGNLEEGAKLAAVSFDETYLNSYVAHATIETHTALVSVEGDKATAWASSQAPFGVRDEVAQAAGISAQNVHVISPFIGGGFGGKTRNTQAGQAARLSKTTGKPVQVTWSRADEFFNDTFRPAAVLKIKSGISNSGQIVFWDYEVLFAGERSSQQFYNIPHHRTVVRGEWGGGRGGGAPSAHPFSVGAWRAPASNSNTFARESQIDIMAAKAGMDPVEFRLMNLNNGRMQRIIKAAAEKFGWTPAKAPSGRGWGVASADYQGTYLTTMAEVAVDKAAGAVQVKRVVCAQDMGIAVNPEGATLQIEGCITMGLGYALTEEVHFKGREVKDLNFDTYQLPRFSWLPKIEAVLLDSPEVAISGGGEPPIITMGAVVANAIFDATGARLYQLPMTPERIKAALK